MAYRFLYPFFGTLAGAMVPLGWLLWRAYSARKDWWTKWAAAEFAKNGESYIVMTVVAVAVCGLAGFLLAAYRSSLIEEAELIKDTNLQLEELASTDGLTGLFNARYMRDRLQIELDNSHRVWLTCLLVDIDHFKKINDKFGHPFGDAVLVNTAAIMRRAMRKMDIVGRLGGEEFLIVLPGAPAERGLEVAERLRAAVEAETVSQDGASTPVTVSIGVASKEPGQSVLISEFLKAADEALYKAKKSGRNRVVS